MAATKQTEISGSTLGSMSLPKEAFITDVKHLASYNWIEDTKPSIAVPGSPAAWSNINQPKQVRKDSGLIYIAQNAARHPDYPLEPLFRALDIEQPDLDISSVDIISDRNNIRKLLSFIAPTTAKGGLEPFTIKVEAIGSTVIFCRDETKVTEFLGPNDFRGFGHEFEKAYTTNQLSGSTGHHRIISYRFDDLNMIIRHETDGYIKTAASGEDDISGLLSSLSIDSSNAETPTTTPSSRLTITKSGHRIPLSSTLEIKTRVFYKPLPITEVAAQLWISQTPNLVRALHNKGVFQVPKVEDTTQAIKDWEKKNQYYLRLLVVLMRKILDVVKAYGKAVIRYEEGQGKLKICKVEAKDMLPEDVYARWQKADSVQKTAGDSEVQGGKKDLAGAEPDKDENEDDSASSEPSDPSSDDE